jgi:membrane associated rhomboid family serine protease
MGLEKIKEMGTLETAFIVFIIMFIVAWLFLPLLESNILFQMSIPVQAAIVGLISALLVFVWFNFLSKMFH